MVGKFALMLCPKKGCAKVGLSKGAKCPDHEVAMVRTVVMTESYVAAHRPPGQPPKGDFGDLVNDLFKGKT